MPPRQIIDLDLKIDGADPYQLTIIRRDANKRSGSIHKILWQGPLDLNLEDLRALHSAPDPLEYGRLLSKAVFGKSNAWDQAKEFAAGRDADLRVRICIEPSAVALHALRWELLCDVYDQPIARGEGTSLLRYISLSNTVTERKPRFDNLKVLIASASPEIDLGSDKPRFSAIAEARRASEALVGSERVILAYPNSRATWGRLQSHLRNGYDIVYLICHGTLVDSETYLWIEDEAGKAAKLSGTDLSTFLSGLDLQRKPLLLLLAACHGAGSDAPDQVASALSLQLLKAGIPTVVAMQGLAPSHLIEQFLPIMLEELQSYGLIDHAINMARVSLQGDKDWWRPALYTLFERSEPLILAQSIVEFNIHKVDEGSISKYLKNIRKEYDQKRSGRLSAKPSDLYISLDSDELQVQSERSLYKLRSIAVEMNLETPQRSSTWNIVELKQKSEQADEDFPPVEQGRYLETIDQYLRANETPLQDEDEFDPIYLEATIERTLLLSEQVCREKRLVLLGKPGSGKSAFLKHLAVALAQDDVKTPIIPGWSAAVGRLLPIYVSLEKFSTQTDGNNKSLDREALWTWLLIELKNQGLSELVTSKLDDALERGEILLLLDDLDKIEPEVRRTEVAQAIHDLITRRGSQSSFIVVACRRAAYTEKIRESLESTWFKSVQVAGFKPEQVAFFIRRWYAVQENLTDRSEELIIKIRQSKNLLDWCCMPIVLSIVVEQFSRSEELPFNRSSILEKFIQTTLNIDDKQIYYALADLAYDLHAKKLQNLTESIVKRRLLSRSADTSNEKILDVILRNDGLFSERPETEDQYEFNDVVLHEYLAAVSLIERNTSKKPTEFFKSAYIHWQEESTRWRDIIFRALEYSVSDETHELVGLWLQFLLARHHGQRQRETKELHEATLFAAECLYEIGWAQQFSRIGSTNNLTLGETIDLVHLKETMQQLLVACVEGNQLSLVDRIRAGELLGIIGDLRTTQAVVGGTTFVSFSGGGVITSQTEGNLICIKPFELSKYPVSNAQFKFFMDDGGYKVESPWWSPDGRQWLIENNVVQPLYWDDPVLGIASANRPVVGVNWHEISAYCSWLTAKRNDGYIYSIANDIEWEYVSSGTASQAYPWGAELPKTDIHANYNSHFGSTTPIGCFSQGATPEGLLDIAGNVWEWARPYVSGEFFVIRGGSWRSEEEDLRSLSRQECYASLRQDDLGFRLLRRPYGVSMSNPNATIQALQDQLAPLLHELATALVTLLDRGNSLEDLVRLPNISLLLWAMAGRSAAGDGKVIDFGDRNQIGDVTIRDVVRGNQIHLHFNLSTQQEASLVSSVGQLSSDTALSGANLNGAPPRPEAAPRPCRVLVLDGRSDEPAAAALRRELGLRGIVSPAPTSLDDLSASALRADLNAADAAILILSPASCAADQLKTIELPEVWGRYGRSAPFTIIPLLDGVGSAVAEATLVLPGTRLEDFRAIVLPTETADRPQALAALAGLLLHNVAGPLLHAAAATRSLSLTLFSYPPSGPVAPADLAVSWDALFPEPQNPTRQPPTPEIWRAALEPALDDLRLVVGATGTHTLAISGRYHLPAGLALGFRFRGTAAVALHIAAQPGGLWRSDIAGDEGDLLDRQVIQDSPDAADVSVEVSLARDVRPEAEAYLKNSGLKVHRRIQLTSAPLLGSEPDSRMASRFISSPAHACRLAEQIANAILAHSQGRIHLFAAIPQGLAVLLGAQLNRTRPVQCYELYEDPEQGRVYVPSVTLS